VNNELQSMHVVIKSVVDCVCRCRMYTGVLQWTWSVTEAVVSVCEKTQIVSGT